MPSSYLGSGRDMNYDYIVYSPSVRDKSYLEGRNDILQVWPKSYHDHFGYGLIYGVTQTDRSKGKDTIHPWMLRNKGDEGLVKITRHYT